MTDNDTIESLRRELDASRKREAAMRDALEDLLTHRSIDDDGNHVAWVGETTFILAESALSCAPPSGYIAKSAVRPLVVALEHVFIWCWDENGDDIDEGEVRKALDLARELGLLEVEK